MTANETTTRDVEKLVEGLVDIGTTWARHGLSIGRTALEASSKTLTRTAELLGTIAQRLEQQAPAAEAPKASA